MRVEIRNRRVYLIAKNRKTLNMSEQYATNWNAKRAAKRMFPAIPAEVANDNDGASRSQPETPAS